MNEVEEIEEELKGKHDCQYSDEQIRAWAHLIQMKKHGSYDDPPNKPFWRNRINNKKTKGKTSNASAESQPSTSYNSPGKQVLLRGQLIDQLSKWHDLLERGAITQQQYEKLQGTIITDVKTC